MTGRKILVVCGLGAEARIARAPGALTLSGGGDSPLLARALAALDPSDFRAVVSFGVAGALAPALRPGDIVVARAIVADRSFACDDAWAARWQSRLDSAGRRAFDGRIAGVDAPVMSPGDKLALGVRSGAIAVDMESHLAAGFAAAHALPFGAIRVISDAADHVLPPVAAAAMKPGGGIAVHAVLSGLVRSPGQVPALIATARDAATAFRVLRQVRALLGPTFGMPDP